MSTRLGAATSKAQPASTLPTPASSSHGKPLPLKNHADHSSPLKGSSWAVCEPLSASRSLCAAGLGVRALPSAGKGAELPAPGRDLGSTLPRLRALLFSTVPARILPEGLHSLVRLSIHFILEGQKRRLSLPANSHQRPCSTPSSGALIPRQRSSARYNIS